MAGRPRKISRQSFLQAHAEFKGYMPGIAKSLGVTVVTAYNYARRLKCELAGVRRHRKLRSRILSAYQGPVSVANLATEFNKSVPTIRYHLLKYIARHWASGKPRHFPKPLQIPELRIIAVLRDEPKLFDDAPRVAQKTGLSLAEVTDYLRRYYERLTKASKSGKRRRAA